MTTTYPTLDEDGDDRYYWDEIDIEQAQVIASFEKHPKRVAAKYAPFGDNTFRVIDSYDGVIAYTNSVAQAEMLVQALRANPQAVETPEPEPLAEWEQALLRGWSFRQGANGTGYIIRARDLDGRFDLGNAFDAIRESTGWKGVVLLSTTYWTDGEETGWQGADEVRWHFQQY